MIDDRNEKLSKVGALRKRRVRMADGQRYLIYYTFENGSALPENAAELSDDAAQNSTVKEEINV